jgi:hypothetical protein
VATSDEVRRAAQDERDRLKGVKAGADLSAAGVAVVSALVAPPVLLVALVPGVIRFRAAKEIVVQERLIEDPPRDDFTERPAPSFEASFPPPRVESNSDFALLYRYARESIQLCGIENAMIVAIERTQGAEAVGAEEFVHLRNKDAQDLAFSTASMLRRLARTQEEVARLIGRYPHFHVTDQQISTILTGEKPSASLNARFYLEAVPDGVHAWLFRLGASLEILEGELEANWPSPEEDGPFSILAASLANDSKAKLQLANALSEETHTRVLR